MNIVFYGLVLLAVGSAAWATIVAGGDPTVMTAVGTGALDGGKKSVTLAIDLAGPMILFMGLLKVVEASKGLDAVARLIRPAMVRLFPEVPADHPAMGAMIMNLAANMLGLVNAATPFGLRAMEELQKLNKHPRVATNAMVLFLAINTSGVAVLPTGMIGLRAARGSADPASIFVTTMVATACSTLAGVAAAKLLERVIPPPEPPEHHATPTAWWEYLPLGLVAGAFLGLVGIVYRYQERATPWIVPLLIVGMLTLGVARGVRVYEVFIDGAKDGFAMAVKIMPYLVAMLASVGMFRASGAMDALVGLLTPVTSLVGFPAEILPLALLRPLSGSGAFALCGELLTTYGPDSYLGQVASTVQGSSETTFYVLALYFGAVGVSHARHAVAAGLAADVAGALASVAAVRLFLQ